MRFAVDKRNVNVSESPARAPRSSPAVSSIAAIRPDAPAMPQPLPPADLLALQRIIGSRSSPRPMQQKAADPTPEQIHAAAARGVASGGGALPYAEHIQAAFGRHNLATVKAHSGAGAVEATDAMNAEAYATGNHIVFRGAPSLRTAAHEAAHIIQQRNGVSLPGGIGQIGDVHERNADAVADAVVAGRSAEGLLDAYAPAGRGRAVQQAIQREEVKNLIEDPPSTFTSAYTVSFDEAKKECNITIRVKLSPANKTVTEAQIEEIKALAIAEVEEKWDDIFSVTDKGSGTKYTMRVKVEFVESGQHADVKLYQGTGQPNPFAWYTRPRVNEDIPHEIGHHLGLIDESVDSRAENRKDANAPGVYTDNSLMGNYFAEGVGKAEIKQRHGDSIARDIGRATGRSLVATDERFAAVTRQRSAIQAIKSAAAQAAAWHNGRKKRGEPIPAAADNKAGEGWTKWALGGQAEKSFNLVAQYSSRKPDQIDRAGAAAVQLYQEAKGRFDEGKALLGRAP